MPQIATSIVFSNNPDSLSYNADGEKLRTGPRRLQSEEMGYAFSKCSWAELSLIWPFQASGGSPYLLAQSSSSVYSHPRLEEYALDHSSDAHSMASPFNLNTRD